MQRQDTRTIINAACETPEFIFGVREWDMAEDPWRPASLPYSVNFMVLSATRPATNIYRSMIVAGRLGGFHT